MARILIAEDDQSVRALLARALRQDGHDVAVSADGGEALDLLTREAGGFDLLLSDIKMPVMDGIALALAVAQDYPALPVVLMTGYAEQRERAAGLDSIVREVVLKPFTPKEISAAVAAALGTAA